MAAGGANFLLNTENYDPLFEIVKQITSKIKENEKILARLANVVDEKINYPDLPHQEETEEANFGSESSNPVTAERDYLRTILDQKFKASAVEETTQFDDVENPVLRQLLSDNYRLLQVKKAKNEKLKQIVQINHEYERLLEEVIVPAVAQDISKRNVETLQRIREKEVDRKLNAQLELWEEYIKYVSVLDKSSRLVEKLSSLADESLDKREVEKLALQLNILERLKGQIESGKPLHRQR